MAMPLLLLTSPQDHVVAPTQSDFLAQSYGGPVERVSLDRSFHVATQDYDKELIFARSVEFASRVTGAAAAR
jgi:carboxylesterase